VIFSRSDRIFQEQYPSKHFPFKDPKLPTLLLANVQLSYPYISTGLRIVFFLGGGEVKLSL
jgi:hypothetical protein